MDDYTTSDAIKIFKPHGSVSWQVGATWRSDSVVYPSGRSALAAALQVAHTVTPLEPPQWRWDDTTDFGGLQDSDPDRIWLPALSIPLRRKSTFTMPDDHRDAMIDALSKTTTIVAIGWRAREEHFLRLLQAHMPSGSVNLIVVAESENAASETVENLWPTGRFRRYALSTSGFGGFVTDPGIRKRAAEANTTPQKPPFTFDELLAGQSFGTFFKREPGSGLPPATTPEAFTFPYADL